METLVTPEQPSLLGFLYWLDAQRAKVPAVLWLAVFTLEILVLSAWPR